MDKVRDQYLKDIKWAFHTGCEIGVDYPQEYRTDVTGFNENSPTAWCDRENEEQAETYLRNVFNLGR
jgi:hypothetical protein